MNLRPAGLLLLACLPASAAEPPALRAATGFTVEPVYQVPRDSAGSWVALAVDPRGRLVVSDQYGPLHRVTLPAPGTAGPPRVERLDLPLGGVHGLAFVGETLFAVAAERIAGGPGLYRVRDTDGDGDLDEVTLLRSLDATGEHGPHAVVPAPDGRSLYLLAGNATPLPPLARAAARPQWTDPAVLPPLPALIGSETRGRPPGGWIARTDLDGREWTLVSAGYRNHYDAAFNADGELFTCDSDTEFDLNLPWYRPTRVLHVVSGSDFGWRPGSSKLPEAAPETLPPVLPTGLGSPTGVAFGTGAKFPERYARALFVADWTYGKLRAVHLRPSGASYAATAEEIVSGAPLPITDLAVNPRDGALYFVTGGRRMHSALYRVRWTGPGATPPAPSSEPAASSARALRHSLERLHGVAVAGAVDTLWPHLGSDDRFLRFAALRALESQPVEGWRARALDEAAPRAGLAALLALARTDPADTTVQRSVARWPMAALTPDLRYEKVRLLARVVAGRTIPSDERAALLRELDPVYPARDLPLTLALGELLVVFDAPRIIERTLGLIAGTPVHETQLAHAATLRSVRQGWTPETRATYFGWLRRAATYRGGAAFRPTIERIKADALATLGAEERATAQAMLEGGADAAPVPVGDPLAGRTTFRAWTVAELGPEVEKALRQPRDVVRGREIFGAVGCFACHSAHGEGGALGPDLTAVQGRFGVRDLLEAIVEPSRVISDQYGTVVVSLNDGASHQGRLVNQTEKQVHLSANLFDPTDLIRLDRNLVREIRPSEISLMPPGLLDRLEVTEIADLIAFLSSPRP